jgi:hypothetical protein
MDKELASLTLYRLNLYASCGLLEKIGVLALSQV